MTDLEQMAQDIIDDSTDSNYSEMPNLRRLRRKIAEALATVQRETRAKDAAIARDYLAQGVLFRNHPEAIAAAIEAQGDK